MPPLTVQLILLTGAYVVVAVLALVQIAFAVLNFRSQKALDSALERMDSKKDLSARLGRVEDRLTSQADLVDSLSKRLNRRDGASSRPKRPKDGDESPEPSAPLTHDDILQRIAAGQGRTN